MMSALEHLLQAWNVVTVALAHLCTGQIISSA